MTTKTRFIHRAARDEEHPYFMLRRATAQDTTLSFEARGLLAYILSKPDDWKVQPSNLQQNCGRSVVYRILAELIEHGYIRRTQTRDENNKIISWDYAIHEEPLIKNREVVIEGKTKPLSTKPEIEEPEIAFPLSGKTNITDKRVLQNKESTVGAKKRRVDPQFDVIAKVWKTSAGGYVSNMQGMMFGSKSIKGEWLRCRFEPSATIEEVERFGAWALRNPDNNGKMPTQAATIQRQFYQFRNIQAKKMIYDNGEYVPIEERTSVLDGIKLA